MNLCSNIPLRTREQHEHDAMLWAATPEKQRATLRELHNRVEADRAGALACLGRAPDDAAKITACASSRLR